MHAPTRIPTELEVDLNELEREFITRWAEGSPGPCPVCNAHVPEGADCPEQHFNQATALTAGLGQKVTLAKAVQIIRARR